MKHTKYDWIRKMSKDELALWLAGNEMSTRQYLRNNPEESYEQVLSKVTAFLNLPHSE